jgi:glycosyltransferase involved in cell wall biosynthesis
MLITHVDDPYKARLIRAELQDNIDVGICMSTHTVQRLLDLGIPASSLCCVPPAHDNLVTPRRIVIGITTRVYPDGRKREEMLVRLSQGMNLEALRFRIFGAGWDKVIPHLRKAGAEVEYDPGTANYAADYSRVIAAMRNLDFYLYLGMDEGSLGTLDALAAGIPTIVTAQGFHLDVLPALTHTFVDYAELEQIIRKIIDSRELRRQWASALHWSDYARRHSLVWHAVFARETGRIAEQIALDMPSAPSPMLRSTDRQIGFYLRALSPRRILSALSHVPILKPLKSRVRRAVGRGKKNGL